MSDREGYTLLNAVRVMLKMKPLPCYREPHDRRKYKTKRQKKSDDAALAALASSLDTDRFEGLAGDLRVKPFRGSR